MRLALVLGLAGCGFEHGSIAGSRSDATVEDGVPFDGVGLDASSLDGGSDAAGGDAPVARGWRRRITWSGVPADLTSFPLLVVLDASRIEYAVTQASELRFVDAATSASLAHEIELWNPAGRSYIWVKAPLVDAAAMRSIWMYYGDPLMPGVQAPAAVWSDGFMAVWHLGEVVLDEATGGVHADSTGHGHAGFQRGNDDAQPVGGIGRVQQFDGASDTIEIATAGFSLASAVTIEARAYCSVQTNSYPHVLASGSDGRFWQIFWDKDTGDAGWAGAVRVAGTDERIRTAAGAIGEWRSLAIVYDGANVTLYMDGASIGSTGASGALTALDTALYLGANPLLSPSSARDLAGYLDEVRISTVARSQAWLQTAHRAATDGLLAFGAREPAP